MSKTRNYRKEYDGYHKSNKQKKRRAGRNKARSIMVKKKGRKAPARKKAAPKKGAAKK